MVDMGSARMKQWMKHPLVRHWRLLLVATLVGVVVIPSATHAYVAGATYTYRYSDFSAVPTEPVAIVFGASVRPDGNLSPMLADRVMAAVTLYQQGRVHKLLMTGDNSRVDYNEVVAMQHYAEAHGVPAEDITLDYAGFSTYESCYRARAIFGVDRAVLVTQGFHLPRAVYTCRALGVDAVGLGTPDWGIYSDWLMRRYTVRESLATLKAVVDVHLTHPLPTFLGPFEGLR